MKSPHFLVGCHHSCFELIAADLYPVAIKRDNIASPAVSAGDYDKNNYPIECEKALISIYTIVKANFQLTVL